jgi:hypothetical protein
MLAELPRKRRDRVKPHTQAYIVANQQGGALDFHNLAHRVIRRDLKGSAVEWKGSDGFRRGLASNLFNLGVHPKVVAAILRHDVATSLKHYIQRRDTGARDALRQFEASIKSRAVAEGVAQK